MEYTNVSDDEWKEIILKFDNAHFFHSPLWAKIIEKTYNHNSATRLYNINGKEILVPMLEGNIYFFKTFDFIGGNPETGGLFSESEITTDDFKAIVKDIVGGRNLSFSLALPPFMNLSNDGSSSAINEEWNFKNQWNYVHLLDLEGRTFEDIWKNYKSKTRTHIRKAKKSGVETRDANSIDDFKTFYDIYAQASKKRNYHNSVPFELYYNIYKYAPSNTRLRLAIKDDKIIAGLLSLTYSKTVYLYMGSFLPEYGRFNPARLLDNEAIEKACSEGYKYVNFGPSGNLKHIKQYKEGFGTEKIELNRYRIHSNLGRIVSKIQNKIGELKQVNLS
ncbi:MAG: lipid II:glycine glycyltransferase FemX [Methanobacterium sp.]